ncbi:hypothetical protein B0H13DRAFT_1855786 [Mycena leptocephala]|nr:hypothetical protein B0H13DRAFT_1855786 [Mycena leptocephala]
MSTARASSTSNYRSPTFRYSARHDLEFNTNGRTLEDIFLHSPGGDVILLFDLNVKFGSPAYLPAAEAKNVRRPWFLQAALFNVNHLYFGGVGYFHVTWFWGSKNVGGDDAKRLF